MIYFIFDYGYLLVHTNIIQEYGTIFLDRKLFLPQVLKNHLNIF